MTCKGLGPCRQRLKLNGLLTAGTGNNPGGRVEEGAAGRAIHAIGHPTASVANMQASVIFHSPFYLLKAVIFTVADSRPAKRQAVLAKSTEPIKFVRSPLLTSETQETTCLFGRSKPYDHISNQDLGPISRYDVTVQFPAANYRVHEAYKLELFSNPSRTRLYLLQSIFSSYSISHSSTAHTLFKAVRVDDGDVLNANFAPGGACS
jgi:hypothetical protein